MSSVDRERVLIDRAIAGGAIAGSCAVAGGCTAGCAIAAAGASTGLGLVDHGHLHAALVELIGGGQAHDARAKDTYLHLVCSTLLTESQCRVGAGL